MEWDWIPDAAADSIDDTLDAEAARLVSIDNLDNTTWLGDNEHFCAVWYKNVSGQVWLWNFGLNKAELPKGAAEVLFLGSGREFIAQQRSVR